MPNTREEYEAAAKAACAMFDGMDQEWVEATMDEAMAQGCSDRFEMFRHVAEAAGKWHEFTA